MFKLSVFYLLTVGSLLLAVNTLPIDETNYELTPDYFEGDMILSPEQKEWLEIASNATIKERKRRHALLNPNSIWPNGILYYELSEEFTTTEINRIKLAMKHISDNTCIRFVLRTIQSNYVLIRPNAVGCSAGVGYRNQGVQFVNLRQMGPKSYGCFTLGIITHELLHALGLYHQQSSSNRDDYVIINHANIRPGTAHNFRKLSAAVVGSYGVGYDYESVMHYGSHAYSMNGLPTIVPLDQNAIIGQRAGLSVKDIQKLKLMYECNEV